MTLCSNKPIAPGSLPLLEAIKSGDASVRGGSRIFLVPTRERVRDLHTMLVEHAPGGVFGGSALFTITDFATKLLGVCAPTMRVISDAEMGIFLELAIKNLHESDGLFYFQRRDSNMRHALPLPRGTFELLLNTIRSLKENAITPERIEEEIREAEKRQRNATERTRAKDLAAIFRAYESLLGDALTDTYGQLSVLNRIIGTPQTDATNAAIHQALRDQFGQVTEVYFHGFLRLEPSTMLLIDALQTDSDLRITVELPSRTANHGLFANLAALEDELSSHGITERLTTTSTAAPDSVEIGFESALAKTLFNDRVDNNPEDFTELAQIWKCDSREEEVQLIARQIKLILERDPLAQAEPSRICIATYSEREYSTLFRAAFARLGIPASVTERYKLDTSGLAASLVALLEMVQDGMTKRSLARALSTPYFTFEKNGERIDAQNLSLVATHEQLTGNSRDWVLLLSDALEKLREEDSEPAMDSFERDELNDRICSIQKALQDIQALTEILQPFEASFTPQEFAKTLQRFFQRTEVRKNMLKHTETTIGVNALERETRSFGAIEKLTTDLTALFELLGIGEEHLPVGFYVDRLRTAMSIERFTPRFDPSSVFVTSLNQLLGVECDYLFIPGLVDGKFPSSYEPQIFLMEGLQQDGEARQRNEERLLFFKSITNFRTKLFLSWPAFDESNAETTQSAFLTALERVATLQHDVPEDLKEGIFSYTDLHEHIGTEISRTGEVYLPIADGAASPVPSVERTILNGHLPKAIAASRSRANPIPGYYSGLLAFDRLPEAEREMLESYGDANGWSISQLETYAKCPFQFLAKNIYRLNATEAVEEGLDAAEQGSAVHKILYDIFNERRKTEMPALQDIANDADRLAFRDEALSIARMQLARSGNKHPFHRLDGEVLLSEHTSDDLFEMLLKAEKSAEGLSQKPMYFEISFGMGADQSTEFNIAGPVEISKGLKLRGKIDRIDTDDATFSIIDYKTGGKSSFKDIEAGLSLQLPLYMRAAPKLLESGRYTELVPVAGLYELVRKGTRNLGIAIKEFSGNRFGVTGKPRSGFMDSQAFDALIDQSIERAKAYVHGVKRGEFPLVMETNEAKACKYCPYKDSCRVREAKKLGALRS